MEANHALLLKTYDWCSTTSSTAAGADTVFIHDDSARAHGAVTGACPHTAFEHPLTPAGVAPRLSIELRALAWYEDCA